MTDKKNRCVETMCELPAGTLIMGAELMSPLTENDAVIHIDCAIVLSPGRILVIDGVDVVGSVITDLSYKTLDIDPNAACACGCGVRAWAMKTAPKWIEILGQTA